MAEKMLQQLFFELIQVAIGQRSSLSRALTMEEWKGLYALLKKHALLGYWVCGDSETAEGAMATESDDSAMGGYCATNKATELGVERGM